MSSSRPRLAETTTTAQELYDEIVEALYGPRQSRRALELGARRQAIGGAAVRQAESIGRQGKVLLVPEKQ